MSEETDVIVGDDVIPVCICDAGPRSRQGANIGVIPPVCICEEVIVGDDVTPCDDVSEGSFCGDLILCRCCRNIGPEMYQDASGQAYYPTSQEGSGQGPAIACAPEDFQVGDSLHFVDVSNDSEEGIILEQETHRCKRRRVHDPPGGASRADAHERIIEKQSATAVAASSSSSSTGAASAAMHVMCKIASTRRGFRGLNDGWMDVTGRREKAPNAAMSSAPWRRWKRGITTLRDAPPQFRGLNEGLMDMADGKEAP